MALRGRLGSGIRRSRAARIVVGIVLAATIAGQGGAAAAGRDEPAASAARPPAPTDVSPVYFSGSRASARIGSFSFANEDVVEYDPATRQYRLVVDASDLGVRGDLDALEVLDDDSFLFSFSRRFSLPELGTVEPSDILRFVPTSLGRHTTRGSLEMFLDGSDVGLTKSSENVDSIAVSQDGRLIVSTAGRARVPKAATAKHAHEDDELTARGEDLLVLQDAAYGAESAGAWRLYLDGSDAGLRRGESMRSISVDRTSGAISYVAKGKAYGFGSQDVVAQCAPRGLPPQETRCDFSVRQALGVRNVDALHVGDPTHIVRACASAQRTLEVKSHADGAVVDATEKGTGTGSFVLSGVAPPNVTSVTVSVAGETAGAQVAHLDCAADWSKEIVVRQSGHVPVTVTASGPGGDVAKTVHLTLVAPDEDDLLVQPAFAETPQFHDRLLSYNPATGAIVFRGDVSTEIEAGDGLGGGPSAQAPDGYLRIVEGVAFDGVNTTATTRQAGLTELIRQVSVDFRTEPGDVDPIIVTTDGSPASRTTAGRPASPVRPNLVIDKDTTLTVDFNIDPGVEFELDIRWSRACWVCPVPKPSLRRLWFEGSLELTTKVELIHKARGIGTGEQPFGPRFDDYRLGGLTIPTPIGVPIVLTFEAESQAFYDLSLSAGMRLQYGLGIRVAAGFEYDSDGTGRGEYRSGKFTGKPPSLSNVDLGIIAEASAGLELDFEVLLYGQGGIEIEARPQIELEAVGDVVKRQVDWELKLVVPLSGKLEVEIRIGPVGWEREFGNLRFVELSLTLFKGTIGGQQSDDLTATYTGPPGAFPGQVFENTVRVNNTGTDAATGVTVRFALPDKGSFVSSAPTGTPAAPAPGSTYTVTLPTIPAGQSSTVVLRWRAPTPGDVDVASTATVTASNRATVGPLTATVPIGLENNCNPCGSTAAGTGLRNRSAGTIGITGVPAGATVTRAVLVWGVLYDGALPGKDITFNGTRVSADVTSTVSGTLCWGDSATVGYAADVTDLVSGNGSYAVTDPPRGTTRVDADPVGALPYTDGATLVVFYVGGGSSSQVLSDFSYNTNTEMPIARTFTDVVSRGLDAKLTLAGPDGQGNFGETFTITGAGAPIVLTDTWDGSDPQQGPSFDIGNLWDTDTYDVSSVLPAGQTSLTFRNELTRDCIGVGASVLEVAQVA